MEDPLKVLGLDQYQRAAHLAPALLTVLPATATTALWFPQASVLVKGLAGGVATAALTTLLMHIGRVRGRRIQAALKVKLGALPSVIALRHRFKRIPDTLLIRYHAALTAHGFKMPTAEEELSDPEAADALYSGAAAWLPDQMRDQKAFYLLHAENRDYGFRRNLLGLRPIGLIIMALSMALNAGLMWMTKDHDHDRDHLIAGAILSVAMAAGLAAWLFVVRMSFVEDAAWAYADRLLAAIENIPSKAANKSDRKSARRRSTDA